MKRAFSPQPSKWDLNNILEETKTQSISPAQKKYNPKHSCNSKTLLINRVKIAGPFFYPLVLLYSIKLLLQHNESQCYEMGN